MRGRNLGHVHPVWWGLRNPTGSRPDASARGCIDTHHQPWWWAHHEAGRPTTAFPHSTSRAGGAGGGLVKVFEGHLRKEVSPPWCQAEDLAWEGSPEGVGLTCQTCHSEAPSPTSVTGAIRATRAPERPPGLSGDFSTSAALSEGPAPAHPLPVPIVLLPRLLGSMVHGATAWSLDHPRQAAGSRGGLAHTGAASHRASKRAAGRRIAGSVTRGTGTSVKAPGPLFPPPRWDVGLRAGAPVRRHAGLRPS